MDAEKLEENFRDPFYDSVRRNRRREYEEQENKVWNVSTLKYILKTSIKSKEQEYDKETNCVVKRTDNNVEFANFATRCLLKKDRNFE